MKKALLTLVLAAALLLPVPINAQTDMWLIVAQKLAASTVKLTGCSGIVIDANRKHVLTAAHCGTDKPEDLLVDSEPAVVVSKDIDYDLLVLKVPELDKPALSLAKDDAKAGQLVASMGYGASLEKPMFRTNTVSIEQVQIESLKGQWVLFENPFVGGQSGGPVVNLDGDLVSIVQMSNATTGIGRSVKLLKEKVGRYFTRTR